MCGWLLENSFFAYLLSYVICKQFALCFIFVFCSLCCSVLYISESENLWNRLRSEVKCMCCIHWGVCAKCVIHHFAIRLSVIVDELEKFLASMKLENIFLLTYIRTYLICSYLMCAFVYFLGAPVLIRRNLEIHLVN